VVGVPGTERVRTDSDVSGPPGHFKGVVDAAGRGSEETGQTWGLGSQFQLVSQRTEAEERGTQTDSEATRWRRRNASELRGNDLGLGFELRPGNAYCGKHRNSTSTHSNY